MANVVDSLAPVFLLIGLGAFLVRTGFLKKEMLKGLNDLAYWIGLPSFIFYSLATVSLQAHGLFPMMLVFLGGTAAALIIAFLAGRCLRLPAASHGTFLQAAFRGNLAFIGLPVTIFALSGFPGGPDGRAQEIAVLALAPIMVIYNVVAVFVLYASHAAPQGKLLLKTGRQLLTNPLILASIAGILVATTDVLLPTFLQRSLQALSGLALPLALLCIGGSLVIVPIKGRLTAALTAAVMKVAIAPLAGFFLGVAVDLDPQLLRVTIIFLACPTAAASYVLARQLSGDEALAASTIAISTLLSMLSLSAAVAFVG